MSTRAIAHFATVFALVGGCTKVTGEAGFGDVQKLTSDRGATRIHWHQGGAEDAEADAAVKRMLTGELTADQAVQIALLRNPRLQATYEDLSVAQADLVQAGLLSNPIFDGEFKFHESGGGLAFEGGVVQTFIELLQLPMRRRIAAGQFEAAKLRVAGAVLDLAHQTRQAFYSLQAQQQVLEMRRTVLSAAEASYIVSKRLREAGNITELDLATERAEYEQAKVDFAAAEAAALANRERLSALMGLWGQDVSWKIGDRLPELPKQEIPLEYAERQAVANSLDLAVFRGQATTARRQLGLVRPFALLGEVEAGVAAEHSEEEGWAIGPSVSLPIPVFDQGQARTASAQAELRRARQLHAATAIDVRAETRAAAIRLRAARERAEYLRNVVLPVRQKMVDEAQKQFNGMQIGVFQLLQARRQQIEAGSQYVEALRDYWLVRAGLQQLMSGRLTPGAAPARPAEAATAAKSSSNSGDH
jgi:cobalt-zinc-cadmium efflux system outer membrane protein